MSASNSTANPPPASLPELQAAMWDDRTVEVTETLKKVIPPLPEVTRAVPLVYGQGAGVLSYLALQVLKSEDKFVVMRAIASATITLFGVTRNITGSSTAPIQLTGLESVLDDAADGATQLTTNFEDEEPVTKDDVLRILDIDTDELGAWFGVLYMAGNKRITDKNRAAFNKNRKSAATAAVVGEAKIFVLDSPFLTDHILQKVYASFLAYGPLRAHMISNSVRMIDNSLMGPVLSFASMFLLMSDFGFGALRIIKEAVIKHPWIRTDFPELQPELHAANEAQQAIKRGAAVDRTFLKAIHGNHFVPVNYNQIVNLTGVCRAVLVRTTPSYKNYGGGKITDKQAARINERLGSVAETTVTDVAAE